MWRDWLRFAEEPDQLDLQLIDCISVFLGIARLGLPGRASGCSDDHVLNRNDDTKIEVMATTAFAVAEAFIRGAHRRHPPEGAPIDLSSHEALGVEVRLPATSDLEFVCDSPARFEHETTCARGFSLGVQVVVPGDLGAESGSEVPRFVRPTRLRVQDRLAGSDQVHRRDNEPARSNTDPVPVRSEVDHQDRPDDGIDGPVRIRILRHADETGEQGGHHRDDPAAGGLHRSSSRGCGGFRTI